MINNGTLSGAPSMATGGAIRFRPLSIGRFAGVLGALILGYVMLSVREERFLTMTNQTNILRSVSVLFVVSLGMTIVVLAGSVDLSMGAILALAGVALERLLNAGVPPLLAVGLVVVGGFALGVCTTGLLIGKVGLPFFVVTLAGMEGFRGLVYLWTDGQTRYIDEWPIVRQLGDGTFVGISVPVLTMLFLLVATGGLLRYTRLGRAFYAVGSNREAAQIAGIRTDRVLVIVFGMSAMFASIAGVMQAGRLGAASPTSGTGIELSAAAAVLLGGTSFSGGSGTVTGTALGVLFVGVLQNGLGLMGVDANWQRIVTAAILITALLIDRLRRQAS